MSSIGKNIHFIKLELLRWLKHSYSARINNKCYMQVIMCICTDMDNLNMNDILCMAGFAFLSYVAKYPHSRRMKVDKIHTWYYKYCKLLILT